MHAESVHSRRDSLGAVTRATITALVTRFKNAFNARDIEAVVALMADDALYEEFTGVIHRGHGAIRAALLPQFRGDFGIVRFETQELLVDTRAGSAVVRWVCNLETKSGPASWCGLDVIVIENGRVKQKLTYAKTKRPLLR